MPGHWCEGRWRKQTLAKLGEQWVRDLKTWENDHCVFHEAVTPCTTLEFSDLGRSPRHNRAYVLSIGMPTDSQRKWNRAKSAESGVPPNPLVLVGVAVGRFAPVARLGRPIHQDFWRCESPGVAARCAKWHLARLAQVHELSPEATKGPLLRRSLRRSAELPRILDKEWCCLSAHWCRQSG
jgi:hypothetical protein